MSTNARIDSQVNAPALVLVPRRVGHLDCAYRRGDRLGARGRRDWTWWGSFGGCEYGVGGLALGNVRARDMTACRLEPEAVPAVGDAP